MLFFTRNPGQSLILYPRPGMNFDTSAAKLSNGHPIRVQVIGVRDHQVRLGVAAPAGLCVLRNEWLPDGPDLPVEGLRWVLARKLKVLRFLRRHSLDSLAAAAGVPVGVVLGAERGDGALDLDDLEKLARALGVRVMELFSSVGRTEEERVILAMLEGEG